VHRTEVWSSGGQKERQWPVFDGTFLDHKTAILSTAFLNEVNDEHINSDVSVQWCLASTTLCTCMVYGTEASLVQNNRLRGQQNSQLHGNRSLTGVLTITHH
jgi:hypothetical protein